MYWQIGVKCKLGVKFLLAKSLVRGVAFIMVIMVMGLQYRWWWEASGSTSRAEHDSFGEKSEKRVQPGSSAKGQLNTLRRL
jgi:hypothetical protein